MNLRVCASNPAIPVGWARAHSPVIFRALAAILETALGRRLAINLKGGASASPSVA